MGTRRGGCNSQPDANRDVDPYIHAHWHADFHHNSYLHLLTHRDAHPYPNLDENFNAHGHQFRDVLGGPDSKAVSDQDINQDRDEDPHADTSQNANADAKENSNQDTDADAKKDSIQDADKNSHENAHQDSDSNAVSHPNP